MSLGYKKIRLNSKESRDEHRLVMEKFLGRKLNKFEVVHHKNGNRKDNRIKNLEIQSLSEHTSNHMKKIMNTKNGRRRLKFLKPYWFKPSKLKNGKYLCSRCKRYLPKESFWRCPSKKVGIRAFCIPCEKQYEKER